VKLRISIEGQSYDVDVEVVPEPYAGSKEFESGLSVPPSVMRPPPPADTRPEDRICRSPIAGIVTAIAVSPGQRVRQDDPVAIIDAMKMQNTIGAPVDGVVEEILVKLGQAVTSGQALCRLA